MPPCFVHAAHARPVNFGQLKPAIARGDLPAVQNAFTALDESTAPAVTTAKTRGSLEAVGAAVTSGNVETAKKSLADFPAVCIAETAPAEATAPTPAPAHETTIDLPPTRPSTTEQIVALLSGTRSTTEILA